IAVLRQRLIEPLAGQARVLRKLHHAAGARDVTKRLCQQRRVIRRFLETCLEVGHHIGFGFEVVSSVPAREGFFLTPSCSSASCVLLSPAHSSSVIAGPRCWK